MAAKDCDKDEEEELAAIEEAKCTSGGWGDQALLLAGLAGLLALTLLFVILWRFLRRRQSGGGKSKSPPSRQRRAAEAAEILREGACLREIGVDREGKHLLWVERADLQSPAAVMRRCLGGCLEGMIEQETPEPGVLLAPGDGGRSYVPFEGCVLFAAASTRQLQVSSDSPRARQRSDG